MVMLTISRKVVNPRWRASANTIVPEDDFDEYVPIFLREPEEVPFRPLWSRPQNANNRMVDPVLKNDFGEMVNSNRWMAEENPYSPWR
jgi:hypothetical protein